MTGLAEGLAVLLREAATAALAAVADAWPVPEVLVCVDDRAREAAPWFGTRDPENAGKRVLVFYCSDTAFLRGAERPPLMGLAPEIWEYRASGRGAAPPAPGDFSPIAAERYLHHHFLFAHDVLTGRVDPALVPAPLAEGFQEAWAVTVDGRLEAQGLPGFDRTGRRAMFSRHFAAAGVLLPAHWDIFVALWEGGLRTQQEVLEAVGRLPGP